MVLTIAYMASVKNLGGILDSIKDAGVPPRFTYEFLKGLGFASSNDRAVLSVLKGLRFLDEQGVPAERYRQYRDRTKSKQVMAAAMREAYGDLFLAHEKAYQLSVEKVKGFFASKTDKGDRVVECMAATFRALAQYADFSAATTAPAAVMAEPLRSRDEETREPELAARRAMEGGVPSGFHYNIQIHLPPTRDIAVYNAIFKALRENLG